MLKKFLIIASFCGFLFGANASYADLNIKFVNFKTCVEKSKLGKQEQGSFEALKKQMETVLEEKDKKMQELIGKLEDRDYIDSISPEAETELNRKFRALKQELDQQLKQYYEALNQANFRIVQKMTEVVNKAADTVAKDNKIDLIVNEETTFFHNPKLDISDLVIAAMDKEFEIESTAKS